MPAPRKPNQLLALSGALDTNPGRYADRVEPESNGSIGDAPEAFDPKRKAVWTEVVSLVPAGILQRSDRMIVELICHLTVVIRDDAAEGNINVSAVAQLRQSLASLGMTPADRSRVTATKAEKVDEWADFTIQ